MAFETVKWAPGRKQEFALYMHNEIFNTAGARVELESKWMDLITQHRARVLGDGTADVPFIGASDIDFPLTSIHADPVYADLMQTLHIPQNFWTVTPLRNDTTDAAKPFERFLSLVERRHIGMRKVNQMAFLDLLVLGTCIYKDYIHHSSRLVKEYGEGDEVEENRKIIFEPRVEHVPLKDFFIPASASTIDPDAVGGAPWVSHRFELTEGQFKLRAEEGNPFLPKYDPKAVKRVLAHISDDDSEDMVKQHMEREEEYVPFSNEKLYLHEVWVRYDVDNDGQDEDLVIIWHQDTQEVLRATYNPFMHGNRPFHRAVYIPAFGFYGIGIGEQDEWSQLAMTRLFNNAINNTLIANQRMYAVPMGANISADEAVYAGKIWTLPPGERIDSVQMGEVYPSIFQMMTNVMQWAEADTGVSELRQGNMTNLPSRTPASTTLSILQEGNKKFDMILSNLREDAMAQIGCHIVQNLIQISRQDPRWRVLAQQALGPQDAARVSQILSGPVHDVKEKLGISVTATSSQVNKEVEKQSFVALMQLSAQIYPFLIQLAQALQQSGGDPKIIADTVQAAYTGNVELLQRLLETFDIRNPELFVPASGEDQQQQGPDPLQQLLQQGAQGAQGAPAPAGGPAGAAPLAQAPGQIGQFLGLG